MSEVQPQPAVVKNKKRKKSLQLADNAKHSPFEAGTATKSHKLPNLHLSPGLEEARLQAGSNPAKITGKKKHNKKRKLDAKSDPLPATADRAVAAQNGEAFPVASRPRLQPMQQYSAVGDQQLAQTGHLIKKLLYKEHPGVAKLSTAAVQQWRQERATLVEGCDLRPVMKFEQAGFPAELLEATSNFASPSPIQAQCWPIIMSGHDIVGIAATGSGKTHAFGLPAICHILAQPAAGKSRKGQPQMLVLAPTRELAHQIMGVLADAGGRCGLTCASATGGSSRKAQVAALRQGAAMLVATPGRLQDLVDDGSCRLDGITYLVLDEADRMLDLGFEPAIRALAGGTRADRQTLMFSATWPASIQRLAAEFQCQPVRVTIGSADLSASHSVAQVVEVLEPSGRDARLEALLRQHHSSRSNRILVFVLYKKEAARVQAQLQRHGWKAAAIHGDLSQEQRTAAVNAFRDGSIPLLVATDVAARGLDIPDVELVLNYSFPLTVEDYCHRIGRTGRAGKTGLSHTFFSAVSDRARAGELINVLREAGQTVPAELLQFGTTVKKKESKLYGAHFKEIDPMQKSSKVTFDFDD